MARPARTTTTNQTVMTEANVSFSSVNLNLTGKSTVLDSLAIGHDSDLHMVDTQPLSQ